MLTLISSNLHKLFFCGGAAPKKNTNDNMISSCDIDSLGTEKNLVGFFPPIQEMMFLQTCYGWREGNHHKGARSEHSGFTQLEGLVAWKFHVMNFWENGKTTSLHMFRRKLPKKIMEITHLFVINTMNMHGFSVNNTRSCVIPVSKILQLSEGGGPVETPKLTLTVHNKNTSYHLQMYMHTYPWYVLSLSIYIYMLLKWMQSDTVLQKTFDDITISIGIKHNQPLQ